MDKIFEKQYVPERLLKDDTGYFLRITKEKTLKSECA